MARKGLSKKTRFDVFKRDEFTCCYCGNAPPNVVLEVDHIIPVSKGGDNDISNLVSSCFDCNRGKGATELSVVPKGIHDNMSDMHEKEDQIKAYRRFIKSVKNREQKDIDSVSSIYSGAFPEYKLTEKFCRTNIGNTFLKRLPLHEVQESMQIACDRIDDHNASVKYFCGVCWNKIKRNDQ